MKCPTIPSPKERDQVIIEIGLERVFSTAEIQSINQRRGMLQCIFLSNLITADGRYLKSFVFEPGPFERRSNYYFPRECPSQKDWETWFNFWHSYVLTGDFSHTGNCLQHNHNHEFFNTLLNYFFTNNSQLNLRTTPFPHLLYYFQLISPLLVGCSGVFIKRSLHCNYNHQLLR
jgi:hypothetical protein